MRAPVHFGAGIGRPVVIHTQECVQARTAVIHTQECAQVRTAVIHTQECAQVRPAVIHTQECKQGGVYCKAHLFISGQVLDAQQ